MLMAIIGGAGLVGTFTVPWLARHHQVRVLDREPSPVAGVQSVVGDACSPDDVAAAVDGSDVVVHMAAVIPSHDRPDPAMVRAAFDVNVASIHLALNASAAAGVRSFVHISTMSVYEQYAKVTIDPAVPPDATRPYGLTKRLGEQVCAAVAPGLGLAACSLRLVYPTADEHWPRWRAADDDHRPRTMRMRTGRQIPVLAASDLAAAVTAAAAYRGPYRPFTITADVEGVSVRPDDTGDVLGWRATRVP